MSFQIECKNDFTLFLKEFAGCILFKLPNTYVQNMISQSSRITTENFTTQLKLICSTIMGFVWKFQAFSIHLVGKSDASKSQYAINNTLKQTEHSLFEINKWLVDDYISTCHFGSQYKYQASQAKLRWHIEQVKIKQLSHRISAWLIHSELQAQ